MNELKWLVNQLRLPSFCIEQDISHWFVLCKVISGSPIEIVRFPKGKGMDSLVDDGWHWGEHKIQENKTLQIPLPLTIKYRQSWPAPFDIIQAVIDMISGWGDYTKKLDEHGRPIDSKNKFRELGLEKYAIANRFIAVIRDYVIKEALNKNIPVICIDPWPSGAPYAVALTHDVDRVGRRSILFLAVKLASVLRFPPQQWLYQLRELINIASSEKSLEDDFEKIINLERKYGTRSVFYFLGGPVFHRLGPRHNIKSRKIINIIQLIIQKNWLVGLHGSYVTTDLRVKQFKKEKKILQKITNVEIIGNRQHYLRLDIEKGFSDLESTGIKVDTTVGFAKGAGFRWGVALPFYPKIKNKLIRILELPMFFMDAAVWDYEVDRVGDIKIIEDLLDELKETMGGGSLLFHQTRANNVEFPNQFHAYEQILQRMAKDKAFVVADTDILEWVNFLESIDICFDKEHSIFISNIKIDKQHKSIEGVLYISIDKKKRIVIKSGYEEIKC